MHWFVSDRAWISLLVQAKGRGVRRYAYFSMLPSDPTMYFDSRPSNVTKDDIPRLESGGLPVWSLELQRRMRCTANHPAVATKLSLVAAHFGITNHVRVDSASNPTSMASALLEALGLGWIRVDWVTVDRTRLEIHEQH